MKNLRVNLENFVGRRGVALALAGTVLVGSSGCSSKNVKCDIKEDHAHLYVNEDNFSRFLERETSEYGDYDRCDDYILIDERESKLRKFEEKNDLLRISDNMDIIQSMEDANQDYLEYRYGYTTTVPIVTWITSGSYLIPNYIYVPQTLYSWTTDSNHDGLTGEQRRCHYVYQGYSIMTDDTGKYVVIPSEYVDSISDLGEQYSYIKRDFYKVVDAEYGNDLDYEDVEEDHEIVDDTQDNNATTQGYVVGNAKRKKLVIK